MMENKSCLWKFKYLCILNQEKEGTTKQNSNFQLLTLNKIYAKTRQSVQRGNRCKN